MLTLEVLHHFPSQRMTLLSSIGEVDPSVSNLNFFNMEHYKPQLSQNLAFQIHTLVHGKTFIELLLMKGLQHVSCLCLVGKALTLMILISLSLP